MKKIYSLFAAVILAVGVNAQTYSEDFENAPSKTAYASANITLSEISWNLTDTVIRVAGAADADWYNGTRSLRFRGYGTSSFTMNENKTGGIGNIEFKYRRYGTDTQNTYNVDWSADGNTWVTIGTFTPTADVQTFSYNLNKETARIRIVATVTGSSNKRANLDDLVLTDYDATLAVANYNTAKVSLVKNTVADNEIIFAQDAKVSVINMNGQVVKSAQVAKDSSLNISELPKGVYVVTAVVNGKTVSQKVIKK